MCVSLNLSFGSSRVGEGEPTHRGRSRAVCRGAFWVGRCHRCLSLLVDPSSRSLRAQDRKCGQAELGSDCVGIAFVT